MIISRNFDKTKQQGKDYLYLGNFRNSFFLKCRYLFLIIFFFNQILKQKYFQLLKNYFYIFIDNNLSRSIEAELIKRITKIKNLQQQIKLEVNQQKREQYLTLLKKIYDELDESLDNISEMSEAMNIGLIFLKDISRDIKYIKVQNDHLFVSIDQGGEDIHKLREKNYQELLAIGKQKILAQSKLVDNIYVLYIYIFL
ncbi:unnamed protein product [Paramecium sonneborni]|uniref:Uncharacterized protein n=1 Tax=Paramecium sonneborni TaxID=65129 RepID=A0A8S1PUW6_9CILI|nr:unnamed protein product [Paramecium sonneborni]